MASYAGSGRGRRCLVHRARPTGSLAAVFAPVSAAVSLGASGIMRCQRALQLITGVAPGIVLGSGVQAVMGEGPVALGVAVFVSMCLAAVIGRDFVGAGAMFINQTASSAVLVIALHRTGTGSERLIDALIGGGVALTMAVLLFPAAPLPLIRDATQDVFAALGEALDHLSEVLAGQTRPDAAWTISISSAFMVDWPRLPMPTPRACGSSGWRHADGVTACPYDVPRRTGGAQPARRHRAEPAARCYRGCPSRRDGTEPATEGNQ